MVFAALTNEIKLHEIPIKLGKIMLITSTFNLAVSEAQPDYIAKSQEDAATYVKQQIPKENESVKVIVEWNNCKVAVELKNELDPRYGVAHNLFLKSFLKMDANFKGKLRTPKLECLTSSLETYALARKIADSLYGNENFYQGVQIDRSRIQDPSNKNIHIGVESLGVD